MAFISAKLYWASTNRAVDIIPPLICSGTIFGVWLIASIDRIWALFAGCSQEAEGRCASRFISQEWYDILDRDTGRRPTPGNGVSDASYFYSTACSTMLIIYFLITIGFVYLRHNFISGHWFSTLRFVIQFLWTARQSSFWIYLKVIVTIR